MKTILAARNLNFGNIIKYPPIYIETGKTVFICGESGCGKSTLLKLLNTTLSADEGEIEYKGQSVELMDTIELRREIMLVSQSVFLFDGTIESNFIKYYEYRETSPLTKEQMQKYIALCQADFKLEERCETMSGGERQRIFIAICLSLLPKVLMLDEPTSALDEKTAYKLMFNIKQFCTEKGITLVIVSHDKKLTDQLADEKIMLSKEVI
jgi:putative ABC transport system ATP-binding protein